MLNSNQKYIDFYKNWDLQRKSFEEINLELHDLGIEAREIDEIINHYKKKKQQDKQKIGFYLMAIGAFIGFLSCVLTMLDIIPSIRAFTLYGLTSIGVCIAFVGAYYVFE